MAIDCEPLESGNGFAHWPETALGGFWKRATDILAASILTVLTFPLLLLIAAGVAATSSGPVIYRHRRIGLGGRQFDCLKFRSMVSDAEARLGAHLKADPEAAREWAANRKLANDPRVTPIGKFLRTTSLDELPQLLNVLRGEMSLVGPRPVVREELARYDLELVHYLRSRPGMTGLWQVSGRSDTSYEARVRFDRNYALNWSLGHDVEILFRTIPALLRQRGAV
jgi:exopolysaccharide production protein ExoY